MSTTLRHLYVDLFAFDTASDADSFVDLQNTNPDKIILIVSNLPSFECDSSWILQFDKWLKKYPGRVFLKDVIVPNDDDSVTPSVLVNRRVPVWKQGTVWQGNLHVPGLESLVTTFLEPLRYDRLPSGEDLYVLGTLSEDQIARKLIPTTGTKSRCMIDSSEDHLLNNLVLISVDGCEWINSKLYVLSGTSGLEYSVQCIQSPLTFVSLYKSAVERDKEGTYLRSLAMCNQSGDSVALLKTWKQMNLLKTLSLLEERVVPRLVTDVFPHKISKDVNYENSVPNKRIDKKTSQETINEILKKNAEITTLAEMIQTGKRARRVIGNNLNSYQWPRRPTVISQDEGVLLSEVIGAMP